MERYGADFSELLVWL